MISSGTKRWACLKIRQFDEMGKFLEINKLLKLIQEDRKRPKTIYDSVLEI